VEQKTGVEVGSLDLTDGRVFEAVLTTFNRDLNSRKKKLGHKLRSYKKELHKLIKLKKSYIGFHKSLKKVVHENPKVICRSEPAAAPAKGDNV